MSISFNDPILFILYKNDVKLFARIGLTSNPLELSLCNMVVWFDKWQLSINTAKCNAFSIDHQLENEIDYSVKMLLHGE